MSMKEKKRTRYIIAAVALIIVLIVVAGTVASVFAYRQLSDANDDRSQSISAVERETNQKELLLSDPVRKKDDRGDSVELDSHDLDNHEKGVLISGVDPDSPAAAAGIRRGTIILEVDGVEVNNFRDLRTEINNRSSGETITLTLLNCDTPEEVSVTLASSGPYLGVEGAGVSGFGIERDFIFPRLPRDFDRVFPDLHHRPEDFEGFPEEFEDLFGDIESMISMVVVDVIADGPAALAGLESGDSIIAIDGQDVNSSEEVVDAVVERQTGDEVTITVDRAGELLDFTVTLGEHPEVDGRAYLGVHLGTRIIHREFRSFEDERNG
jgi:PDZ domain-containing secreted protein